MNWDECKLIKCINMYWLVFFELVIVVVRLSVCLFENVVNLVFK